MSKARKSDKPFKKATNIEVERRAFEVQRMLLECKGRPEILQYMTNKYDMSVRTADFYIHRARRIIHRDLSKRETLSIGWHIRARQNIIDKATEQGDTRAALAALADIAKLQGMYIEKTEVTGKDGAPIEIKWPDGSDPTA